MRLLVTGASGFLGSNVAVAARQGHEVLEVIAHSSRRPVGAGRVRAVVVDLCAPGAAAALIADTAPDLVVSCAALADVDACERDQPRAERLNAEVPGELAAACQRIGARFVHVSTDAVFGAGPGPFTTGSEPVPLNHYGVTKLRGEQRVLAACDRALVLRTNIVGWSPTGARSLLELFHGRLTRREPAPAFTDVYFRPMAASDFWALVQLLVAAEARGLWHATGADLISKHDFAVRVAHRFGLDGANIRPASVADAGLAAVRANHLDVVPSELPAGSPPFDRSLAGSLDRLHGLAASGYRDTVASFASPVASPVTPPD